MATRNINRFREGLEVVLEGIDGDLLHKLAHQALWDLEDRLERNPPKGDRGTDAVMGVGLDSQGLYEAPAPATWGNKSQHEIVGEYDSDEDDPSLACVAMFIRAAMERDVWED